ncbi:MAG: chorismate mutase [Candidatus Marinimicrobia bacterium]|nr:chorismate mutase [Candidatus Neomarinimicrobiota bacterium]
MNRIEEIRKAIDSIDTDLLKLLNDRARLAIELGELKHDLGLAIYDPAREREIIEMMLDENEGPLDDNAVVGLFQRIIDESRRVEKFSVSSKKITTENK